MAELQTIKNEALTQLEGAQNLEDLEIIYKQYLGKKGILATLFEGFKNLPDQERKTLGIKANQIKVAIEEVYHQKTSQIKHALQSQKLQDNRIDVTMPGCKMSIGHLHPLTLVQREVEEIFSSMGFAVAAGPEVETEWYNFDALNIPSWHPARDMWDTFWLKHQDPKTKKDLLLRTHTSPVQIRYMEKHQPPIRIIAPGKVFRYEATDASHEIQFHQVEGLMVDKNISVANFKWVIESFFQRFLNDKNIKIRLRPSFFPFTEPSFEIDVSWGKKWLELAGAGMVHPNVYKSCDINPEHWTGFAFGMGLDRLTMIKYKINDIRLFYQNDLRFLNQF